MLKKEKLGFTLIELLIVIAIVAILAGIIVATLGNPTANARDSKRLSDIEETQKALNLYFLEYNRYPSISADVCCDGWDQGPCGDDPFIGLLEIRGFINQTSADPKGGSGGGCYGYNYYRYPAGCCGCDSSKGPFYVLGVRDMETSGRPHPDSPGWSCPNRNWQNEFDWVIGEFESPH